ncbi:hypothetical protein [Vibrio renipiscarius]|uniref:DUF218 domain-containing protein n=2 Tax=Vibrio renipiscarius TaxID=1461322 RepID=A0A0C2NE00_9VIBR|nr:hypothetical protein [Vibrio renipiscarius]KII76639.1 hypothetical protein OJ16_17830 [Vibrio renipiscarius]KII77841.1 hypothetical protein PL18_12740 [Vibrio renipiscarius]
MRHFCDFVQDIGFMEGQLSVCSIYAEPTFNYHSHRYLLGDEAKKRVYDYLTSAPLFMQNFGSLEQASFILGFSFGDSDCVNQELANLACIAHQDAPALPLYLQQEIAVLAPNLPSIPLEEQQYQTTRDVAEKATRHQKGREVAVLAQAWHAKRCIETCQSIGLDVVALRVVNGFPANDPQPWVRNPINWVIKESLRDVGTGYEISQQ